MVNKKQYQNQIKKEFIDLLFYDLKDIPDEIGGITRGSLPFLLVKLNSISPNLFFISSDEKELYEIYEECLSFDENKNEIFISEIDKNNPVKTINFINSLKKISSKKEFIAFLTYKSLFENSFIEDKKIILSKNKEINFNQIIKNYLNDYERVNFIKSQGEYAIRGGIIDIFLIDKINPVRIIFDGNLIEDIREFDPFTQKSIKIIDKVEITNFIEKENIYNILKNKGKFISYNERFENIKHIYISNSKLSNFNFDFVPLPTFFSQNKTMELFNDLDKKNFHIFYIGENYSKNSINCLIKENFISVEKNIAVIGEKRKPSFITSKYIYPSFLSEIKRYEELKEGDYVVHIDFGIGRFKKLINLEKNGVKKDYLLIEYFNDEKLYIPVEKIDRIKKYIGDSENVTLSRLGGNEWKRTKEKSVEDIKKVANELLNLYAKREIIRKEPYKEFKEIEEEFDLSFDYELTEDQLKAVEDIRNDLSSEYLTERVICGDVGFGKTEVALRGALRVILNGKQVLLLTPTTLLALQHYRVISDRFKNFPIRVEMLSRLTKESEEKKIVDDIKNGKVDLLIATHRALSEDISFFDLGLLIIDEEHLFGVEQKEKIKKIKEDIDVLYLTATPIPRTLEMALSGIRKFSIIRTPPIGRYPIETYVSPFNPQLIKEAIVNELKRGGQVYYVHNRIITIEEEKFFIQSLVPNLRILVLHGQCDSKEIEEGMISFLNKEYDLLLSTTIIEAGLDNENVNTIIVVDSQNFGLSQLYQLRGRVGRRDKKAFAYLFYDLDKISENGKKRLKVLQDLTYLGAGFQVALKDLEIRGAGNLLGKEQSGFINSIGFDLYMELLEEEISKLKGVKYEKKIYVDLDVDINTTIPENYIPYEDERLFYYRKFFEAKSFEEIKEIEDEISDRFGFYPENIKNLIELSKIKIIMKELKIKSISRNFNQLIIKLSKDTPLDQIKIITLEKIFSDRIKFTPSEIIIRNVKEPIEEIKKFIKILKI
ncbi:MAG TPA: transcription-repair coupling factor [Caldisericia bacterium]|nr:transcription-repair coupling factor [Caldisericia bacterium]HPP43920.1 transcription-repair coupling factor [Caldisericia bacterium]